MCEDTYTVDTACMQALAITCQGQLKGRISSSASVCVCVAGGGVAGAVPEKNKGSSFVGVGVTPLKPLPSCYRVKQRRDQL